MHLEIRHPLLIIQQMYLSLIKSGHMFTLLLRKNEIVHEKSDLDKNLKRML